MPHQFHVARDVDSTSSLSWPFHDLSLCAAVSTVDYLRRARASLEQVLAMPSLAEIIPLTREPGRYSRTLIFGDDQISVWSLLWPPGSHTSIHDHHCSCCFGVFRGVVTERWFQPLNERDAVLSTENHRAAGFVAAMLPTGPNVHQMLNETQEDAISIHIYGFNHRLHESSIEREYRVVDS